MENFPTPAAKVNCERLIAAQANSYSAMPQMAMAQINLLYEQDNLTPETVAKAFAPMDEALNVEAIFLWRRPKEA